jgi:hypothetical protein
MTLTRRQERLLRHADRAISRSSPELASKLLIFGRISAGDRLPAREQLRPRLTAGRRALACGWCALWWLAAAISFAFFCLAGAGSHRAAGSFARVRGRGLRWCPERLRPVHGPARAVRSGR